MFRHPRQTEPDRFSMRLSDILHPLAVIPWGGTRHVDSMIVVQDDDYADAIEKLENAGFVRSFPICGPAPEIMESLPNKEQVLEEVNAGYQRFDRFCAVFDYPQNDSAEKFMQVYLFRNSFAHIFPTDTSSFSNRSENTVSTIHFQDYGNLYYPLEPMLVESFVKAAIDEETDIGFSEIGFSAWDEELISYISMMAGYLEVENDIFDLCPDKQAVDWYSCNFGRIRETKFGPLDHRISKRLGSGKEMPNRYER
ncbi:hypothetical protein N7450_005702 [Penicillium hetheringtonii]|uniref:Uncharacterized protein n=1 Tax=Penicillium hetheringtonii TaxID=911720 RepID=A0AAD6DJ15_9EURO|nr:hypothetical protein N7450_005702 [Penicillium hetheringtonii]